MKFFRKCEKTELVIGGKYEIQRGIFFFKMEI